ncbi:DUF2793 domain-containing protein, partial [bacterium]|nr:DUF2793 domain-containing protein [Candidatus Elulimicrobium humile]
QLKYGHVDTDLNSNTNWVVYSPGGEDTSSEWSNSVQEYVTVPSVFTEGYRYLVKPTGTGLFSGRDNQIATWNLVANTFSFVGVTEGQTLRVDNEKNVLYKYQSGTWVKEYLNQVRYLTATSSNGLSYSSVSIGQNNIDTYSYSVYYVSFGITSSGTVSLSIDSLPHIEIKKLQNNILNSCVSGDLVPNLQYQLIYNNGVFQTVLPQSLTTTIGPAEDGDYTDGLFTDFVTSTPIGTAVDRFNEVLKLLVPSSAPELSSWSATGSFVNGGLSFDNTTSGSLVTATSSPYGAVSKGGTFSNTDSIYRLGITSKVTQPITGDLYYQDISGILNSQVLQSTQTPTPAYSTYSFGFGSVGTVSMILNGVTISTVGLTGGAVDTTSAGATSGLNISAATSSRYPNGYTFDTHQNRTGTFLIKRESTDIVDGYNYVIIRHDTPTNSYVLNRYEWVADGSTSSVTATNPQITSVLSSGSTNILSGIWFFERNLSMIYDVTLGNIFSNTFNTSTYSVTYKDRSIALSSPTNNVTNTITVSDDGDIFTPTIDYSPLIPNGTYDPSATMIVSMTFSLNSRKRRINDNIGFGLVLLRTVQGTFAGATSSLVTPVLGTNWFIDSYPDLSTPTSESFTDEVYRLRNGSSKYNYLHLTSRIMLIYPSFNFSNPGPGSSVTNPNYSIGNTRDYSNANTLYQGFGTSSISSPTNFRTYTRYFNLGTTNYSQLRLVMTYSNCNFVNATQNLTGNNLWIEIKLPYGSGSVPGGTQSGGGVTGWLDLTKPFIIGQYADGDGCYEGTAPTASGQEWLINLGIKGTQWSGGNVLFRVTASDGWSGNISYLELTGRE